MLKLYCSIILLCLSISILTNQSERFIQLNDLSNNVVAILLMPIYMPYRIIKYVVLNIDQIIESIKTILNKWLKILGDYVTLILNQMIRQLENIKYIYIIFVKPILINIKNSLITSIHKILAILDWLWHLLLIYLIYPTYELINKIINLTI